MNPILELHPSAAVGPAPGLTFDAFIAGDSNREALSATKAVLMNSGNLLILCGGSGTGKTHLLNAVHAELLAKDPAAVIKHLNADDFTGYLIQSIRTETTEQFRAECQTADAFLLDDVQFLSGKPRTQEELLLILQTRSQAKLCTMITADLSFEDAASICDRLCEQFPNAVSAAISEPDQGIRAALVRAKAKDLGLFLSEEEMNLIAQQVSGNLRSIHGILTRINFYRSFPEAFPDAPSVAEIVRSINS